MNLKNRCTIVQMADVTAAMLIEIGVTIYDDLRYVTRAMLERCILLEDAKCVVKHFRKMELKESAVAGMLPWDKIVNEVRSVEVSHDAIQGPEIADEGVTLEDDVLDVGTSYSIIRSKDGTRSEVKTLIVWMVQYNEVLTQAMVVAVAQPAAPGRGQDELDPRSFVCDTGWV